MNNVIRITELISQKVEDISAIEALLLESDFSKEELMEIAITAAKVYEFSDVYDEFRQSLFESFGNTKQDEEGWYVRIFWPYTPDYMQEILSHPLLKILKALLECGLDPKLRLDNEDTDVMNELMYVDVPFLGAAAMRLLLEHGADPYIADSSGEELFVYLDSCMAIDIGLLPDSIVQVYFQCWLVLIGYGARPEKVDPFHLNPGHSYEELKEFEYFDWKIRYEADKGENIMHIIDIRTGTEIGYLQGKFEGKMTVYLSYFELPDREVEISLIRARMSHNGGINGYIDNGYPFVTVELANALTITHYVSVKY